MGLTMPELLFRTSCSTSSSTYARPELSREHALLRGRPRLPLTSRKLKRGRQTARLQDPFDDMPQHNLIEGLQSPGGDLQQPAISRSRVRSSGHRAQREN